jgi:hypothetical protein
MVTEDICKKIWRANALSLLKSPQAGEGLVTRTVHGLVLCSYPSQALTLLPSRRLVACIIAMSVELRKMGEATGAARRCPQSRQIDF